MKKTGKGGEEVAIRDENGKRVRVEHPRWRAILMQSTIEYAVQFCLFKKKVNAQIEVLKYGDVDDAIGQSAMVGLPKGQVTVKVVCFFLRVDLTHSYAFHSFAYAKSLCLDMLTRCLREVFG